ncbi:MAG: hypothetical protein N2444_03865, partial [Methylocystis sp.]|nr:hypothetical protein [Methylocystis sp.]
ADAVVVDFVADAFEGAPGPGGGDAVAVAVQADGSAHGLMDFEGAAGVVEFHKKALSAVELMRTPTPDGS